MHETISEFLSKIHEKLRRLAATHINHAASVSPYDNRVFNGKWSRSPITIQETEQLAQKNRQNNKTNCKYLKDELVNGEMAAVYSVHDVSPQGVVDSQIWISKAKGLPLHQEDDVDKTHNSSRYEYGDVKPPI
jgi:hypothetical protein